MPYERPERAPVLRVGLATLGIFALVSLASWGLGLHVIPRGPGPLEGEDPAESLTHLASGGVQDTSRVVTLGRLGAELTESSGIAVSRRHSDLFWSHNDGEEGRLYGVRTDGTVVTSLDALDDVEDWEDIALAPCPADGPPDRDCLYVADVGDNDAERERYAVDVVLEPDPGAGTAVERLRRVWFRFPDGPADTEALAVTPGGEALLITKGSDGSGRLYRLAMGPDSASGGSGVRPAELMGMLPLDVSATRDRITAAAVSPDGKRLAVRNHHAVHLFPMDRPLSAPLLCEIGAWQPQGEGLDFVRMDMLILTSEEEGGRSPIIRLRCP